MAFLEEYAVQLVHVSTETNGPPPVRPLAAIDRRLVPESQPAVRNDVDVLEAKNGQQFITAPDIKRTEWAEAHGMKKEFIQQGKLTQSLYRSDLSERSERRLWTITYSAILLRQRKLPISFFYLFKRYLIHFIAVLNRLL